MAKNRFYFVRFIGLKCPVRRGLGIEWCRTKEEAIEMANRLNAAEKLRHEPGQLVEAVRIEVSKV